ncbi:hypothetical protein [Actinocorallia sp. A-T 12471]|uniref:hypothetical protein n=1 Tax=Actinocorallia sp. A-T 12471 TaxID=3089813 RepID=UPI0029D1EE9F|nr:hypothetical protein [Actinocorallia sp. A-T 12471]MDX6738872.1 hypothetical protein [Actinocorallia sp. A-T 12471]
MPHVFPEWVAELTDPRRARTLEELADRLVPLAEQAVDVSRRLQEQLADLNAPFETDALRALVDGLQRRAEGAFTEVNAEIEGTARTRMDRLLASERPEGRDALRAELIEALTGQQRVVAERLSACTGTAVQNAAKVLLDRTAELARSVAGLVQQVLPAAQEGLALAGRVSGLTGRVRAQGRGGVPRWIMTEAAELAGVADETLARLELEWSMTGARAAAARTALRAAEEAAVSEVTAALAREVADLAPEHIRVLGDLEHRVLTRIATESSGDLPESVR